MSERSDLDRALDDLDPADRSGFAVAAAEARDRHASAGAHRMAALWSAIACAAADSRDRERSTLAAMQDDLDGGTVTFGEDA